MRTGIVFVSLFAVFFLSCKAGTIPSIAREDPFTLNLGRLEDQIDLLDLEGRGGIRKTRIAIRDGLFYISNGNGQKITRYTSFGDLLFMIYNDETNPPPLTLKPLSETEGMATRWAVSYPLREPGELAVDSRKHIFVEDRMPPDRHSYDSETRALMDSTVLHFDADGRFIEYLGREGTGGTPFPRINGIYTSAEDDLAVVCRLPSGWQVYWFNAQGTLLWLVKIANEELPIPPDRDVWASMDTIVAAPDERKLYLKLDYYRNTYDESTNTKTGSVMDSSVIWIMNVSDGVYTGRIEVPFYSLVFTENNKRVSEDISYSLLGAVQEGRVMLYAPEEGGYAMLLLYAASQEQQRAFIRVDADELQYNALGVSGDGILFGLFATLYEANVVWWRTDLGFRSLR
ncbi:MAG: hypothetical protein LBK40_09190 [Spirochaetaceae bacterium]|jgi:hypothetical protein|nr:hypothetical protein [Spirochaetaceae bacterium]